MTTEWANVIANILTFLGIVITAWLAWLKLGKVEDTVQKIAISVDGRLTQLLAEQEKVTLLKVGEATAVERERGRDVAAALVAGAVVKDLVEKGVEAKKP